jgi:hypothetical protein
MDAAGLSRPGLIRRGQRLEYFTIVWNSLEAIVSIVAGLLASSIALIGFGLDSVIEVASGTSLLWRLHHDLDELRRNQVERSTLRFVGARFIALGLYIVYESCSTVIRYEAPQASVLSQKSIENNRDRVHTGVWPLGVPRNH